MTTTLDAREFHTGLQRLERLLQEAERFSDPAVQSHLRATVRAVLDLHGAGLERILGHLAEAGEAGRNLRDVCARDEVVSGLLLLHGLHPLDVEARVRQALEDVRPYLRSHGGNVELVELSDAVVRLRLEGSCHSCPSSAVTMRQTIEEAIIARAPDVTRIEVEGLTEEAPVSSNGQGRVALPLV
jgi:Fe-S cluster biogenesis protein NfuA